ncbi:glycosyltransferase family 2 protein [Spirosoma daeguense]
MESVSREDVVSICIATYNGEKFIAAQLQSVLLQLAPQDEVVISDDHSTDNTRRIIEQLNDKRIRFQLNEGTRGPIGNFENAIRLSRGKHIFLCDQDDIWFANKVPRLKQALQQADLVVCDCNFIDQAGNVTADSFFKVFNSGKGWLKNFTKNTFIGNCMAFNSSAKSFILPFPKELYSAAKFHVYHDFWIGLICSTFVKVEFIPETLSSYRRHSSNLSPTVDAKTSPNSLSQKLSGRGWLLLGLIKRFLKVKFRL